MSGKDSFVRDMFVGEKDQTGTALDTASHHPFSPSHTVAVPHQTTIFHAFKYGCASSALVLASGGQTPTQRLVDYLLHDTTVPRPFPCTLECSRPSTLLLM